MSTLAIFVRLLNGSIMLLAPLFLALAWTKRTKTGWRLFGIGATTFIASQVLHIPFNIFALSPLLERTGLDTSQGGGALAVVALALGLSAGIFEEIARYLVYRHWLKKERSWHEGIMLGLGHGGVESIIVGVLALYTLAQIIILRGENLAAQVPAEHIELAKAQIMAYWNMPWHTAILGAVERLAAMSFHIGASIFVLQSLRRDNLSWLGVAIAWHTLLDGIAVFGAQSWNIYITEAAIVVFGGLSLLFAFLLRDKASENESPKPLAVPEISRIDYVVTSDELDDSRFGQG